jgi:beta-glucanase (GH16 family)
MTGTDYHALRRSLRDVPRAALLAFVALCAVASSGWADDGYRLVWSDEFDRDGVPNPEDWTYEHGFVRNEELQWYGPQNAYCRGGRLVIEARREQVVNPRYDAESRRWNRRRAEAEYTSASVTTRKRKQWLYGRFVMRGRIDTRPGLWPAFWTLGTARGWPGCGEIDIMEYYDGKLLANACWLGRRGQPDWDATEKPLASFDDPDWSNEFHDWRMDWDRDYVRLYVNDQLLNEIDVEAAVNSGADDVRPFREPQYLILNLAVGGTRGGDPAATEFPARFEIDFVRVYQQTESAVESE